MSKITKQMNFVIKQVGLESDRTLRFIGSDESIDRDDDIIEVAGWQTDDYMKNPVFLWAHNYSTPPVGKCVKIQKDTLNKKLMFDIKFPTLAELSSDIQNPSEHAKFVDTIYNLYKGGYLSATSVGFIGVKYKTRDDDDVLDKPEWQRGRRYIEQDLLELSGVAVPSNPGALQTAKSKGLINDAQIKSFGGEDTLNEVELLLDSNTKEIFIMSDGKKVAKAKCTDEIKVKLFNAAEIKSGAKLSTDSKTQLEAIHKEMDNCMKSYKDCQGMLRKFIDNSNPPEDPDDANDQDPKDKDEDPITESEKDIDLEKIDIKDLKPSNSIDLDAETLKTVISGIVKEALNSQIK